MDSSPAASIISAIYPCHTPARPRSCNADILTCYGGYRWLISYATCPVAPTARTTTWETYKPIEQCASLAKRPVLLHLLRMPAPGAQGIQEAPSLAMRPGLSHLLPRTTGDNLISYATCAVAPADRTWSTGYTGSTLISYATCLVAPAARTRCTVSTGDNLNSYVTCAVAPAAKTRSKL